MRYAHIASKVFNRPLLCAPRYLTQVGDVLLARMRSAQVDIHMQDAPTRERTYAGTLIQGDTATLEIFGTITRRPLGIEAMSGPSLSDLDTLMPEMESLARDNRVRTINMVYDTNGGEDNGLFEAARVIRDVAREKQVNAWLYDRALSAGYLLASAANDVYISPEGDAGSIGVWMLHLDISKALEDMGVTPTLISSGARKTEGNPFEALPESVREQWQGEVDEVRQDFVSAVAGYRNISAETVYNTEAAIYRGQAAVNIGLADAVATPRFPAQSTQETTTVAFRNDNAGSGNDSGADARYTQADLDAARASGFEDGETLGKQQGAATERARWSAALEGVESHQLSMAVHQLAHSDMDAETVKAGLAHIAKPAAQSSAFNVMMDSAKNPDVTADVEQTEDEQQEGIARMLDYHRKRRGAA